MIMYLQESVPIQLKTGRILQKCSPNVGKRWQSFPMNSRAEAKWRPRGPRGRPPRSARRPPPPPSFRGPRSPGPAPAAPPAPAPRRSSRRPGRQRASVSKISAKCCSFSAVSAPIFARKYAFCSISQNLPDYLAEFFEIWQNFAKFATFAKMLLNFHKIADFSNRIFAKILRLQRCKRMQIL